MDMCFELAGRIVKAHGGASPSSTRSTVSGSSTTATCWASSTAPRTRTGHLRCPPPQIGDEDPDFAGGCYVHVQKYLHDMTSWESLSVTEQELVIGRTKLEDIEMDDDVKPANSHIALNVIEDDDGNELKIVRHNMPFGEIGKGEFGTYFIGYSRTAGGHRADADQHVHRRPTGQHRPHPGLLDRRHRRDVLHARSSTSSTIHRRFRIRTPEEQQPRSPRPVATTARWGSAA